MVFALFVPVPCRSTVDADPEPCDEWARGYLRACPDFKHRQRQTALLRKAARERRLPGLVWEEPMARMAILGGALSAVLVAIAIACYLVTRIF